MEKKGIIIRIVALVVGVILLALATRMWIKANGLDQHSAENDLTKPEPPALSRTVDDIHRFGYLELGTQSGEASTVTEEATEEIIQFAEKVESVTPGAADKVNVTDK